jgi:hypothetical protein
MKHQKQEELLRKVLKVKIACMNFKKICKKIHKLRLNLILRTPNEVPKI